MKTKWIWGAVLLITAQAHAQGITVVLDQRNISVSGSAGFTNDSVPLSTYAFSRGSTTPYADFAKSVKGTAGLTAEPIENGISEAQQISKVNATTVLYQSNLSTQAHGTGYPNQSSVVQATTASSIQVVFTVPKTSLYNLSVGYSVQMCNSHGAPAPVDWVFSLKSSKGVIVSYVATPAPWCNSTRTGPELLPGSRYWHTKGSFKPGETYTLELKEQKKTSERSQENETWKIATSLLLTMGQ